MASQSLYRKWRSQTFSDLIGQEAVVRTLLNAVRDGRLAHAYLFCGPRGTGKTSTARLLAKAVNCTNPRDGEPCNVCVSCLEITSGRSPDVIEIDAASNTGVDNIRDLRENVNLLGSGGHYKVYVVDEVHMLSTAAFNALLKTLEEPPPHVIFVLATTEAHKVLQTVISRCQRFDFRRIGMSDIVARIHHVAQGEGLELDAGVAELLARAAQGGLRDALSLLDQAMAFCGTHIDLERTRRMLGLADPTLLRLLIEQVAEQRAAEGLHLIHELVTAGADLRQITTQLAEEWRALMLARAGADVAKLLDRTDDEARDLGALAGRFSLAELMACARVFARNETPARGLPVPQLALELAFLECVSIRANGGEVRAQPTATATTPRTQIAAPKLETPGVAPSIPAQASIVAAVVPVLAEPPEIANAVEELDLAAIEAGHVPPILASAPLLPSYEPIDEDDGVESEPDVPQPLLPAVMSGRDWSAEVLQKWTLIKKVCRQKSAQVSALLNSVQPMQVESGNPPLLVIQAKAAFHLEKLREPAKRETVEWALEQVLETPMRVRLALASETRATGKAAPRLATPTSNAAAPAKTIAEAAPTSVLHNGHSAASEPLTPFAAQQNGNGHAAGSNGASTPTTESASAHAAPSQQALEEEVRADPVVREILKTGAVELAEVRPLAEDEA
ncbi:MAG TPA: DNA polymerase III subunit gamma/tau [Ktedonobacterales bacterium]|jgi:DNA polymerase-3 subunit gamma/tau|nr:DNA polymerase III subunit gamma/tau [Ktedonobacterales bacterium]